MAIAAPNWEGPDWTTLRRGKERDSAVRREGLTRRLEGDPLLKSGLQRCSSRSRSRSWLPSPPTSTGR